MRRRTASVGCAVSTGRTSSCSRAAPTRAAGTPCSAQRASDRSRSPASSAASRTARAWRSSSARLTNWKYVAKARTRRAASRNGIPSSSSTRAASFAGSNCCRSALVRSRIDSSSSYRGRPSCSRNVSPRSCPSSRISARRPASTSVVSVAMALMVRRIQSGLRGGVKPMPDPNGASPLKRQSARLTEGDDRAPARSMLRAIGFSRADLAKPLIGVGHSWIETMPCNYNHRRLTEKVKAGVRAAGGTPMEFNTIAVSDGVSMGTEGMKASLVSREVIADSIELVARGHLFDGLVLVVGCDKTIPAAVMALVRLNLPGLALYSGTIGPGRHRGRDITLQDVFEAVGAVAAGTMTRAELGEIEEAACPGAGACGGQFTANTMATAIEFLGISPAGANDVPALDPHKDDVAEKAGRLVMDLIKKDVRPRQIVTRAALENAIASVAATGGSTNGVLHLLAIAREAGVPLSIDDFDRVASRTPVVASLKPGGEYVAKDLHDAGGIALVAQRLSEGGLINGGARTVDGRTMAQVATAAVETPGQKVVTAFDKPLKPTGGLAILRGNLAPEGCVVKLAGHERLMHRGPARVFDSEEAAFAAVEARTIKAGDVVVI